jgi:hypothetical protein
MGTENLKIVGKAFEKEKQTIELTWIETII